MVNSFKSVNNEEYFFKKYANGEEHYKSKSYLNAPAEQNICRRIHFTETKSSRGAA